MRKTMTAAAALLLGVAVAASAQAHGTARHSLNTHPRQTMQSGSTMPPQAAAQTTQRRPMSKQQAKKLQRQLRADGLYRGKVDGIVGPRTRQALAKEQRQGTTGFGSSMPSRSKRSQQLNNQSLDNGNTVTPQTGQSTAGAGSSMPPQDQSLQNQNTNLPTQPQTQAPIR